MQQATHAVAHAHVSYTTGLGEQLSRKLKAYRFSGHKVYWSVQALFSRLSQHRASRLSVGRETNRQHFDSEVYCEALQQDAAPMLEKSFKSHTAAGTQATSKTVSEFTLSTLGLLLMLTMLTTGRREAASRENAVLLLEAVLVSTQLVEACGLQLVFMVVAVAAALCKLDAVDGRCCHLRSGLDFLREERSCPQRCLARRMQQWGGHLLHCPSCAHAVKVVANQLAGHVQSSWGAWGELCAAGHDRVVDHRGKALHHDAHYKKTLKDKVMKRRRCSTIRAATDSKGSGRNTARTWATADMEKYQVAAWRSFVELTGTFVLQEDAARLGQPAQEINSKPGDRIFHEEAIIWNGDLST